MTETTMHIMIIWSNAKDHKDYIIESLKSEFSIIKMFKISWDKNLFIQNLSIFYSHSLKDKSQKQVDEILKNKCKRVGDDTFDAIIFEDKHPDYQERRTTSGIRVVNAHVFDKKMHFREITGGGSRIHCSDNSWETNKDLTILMGLNLEDFLIKYHSPSAEVDELHANCIGVGGYSSIQQLFYVLNNTIKYCVLRNHECLPDEYTVEGHGDIDLLVEHKQYVSRLTGARSVFLQTYRVYHIVKIGGIDVPFDFRYVGDNYYDPKWEENIIESRILRKNLFYTPNPINQYYSLLYHAYIQKPYVKPDYPQKLSYYGSEIGIEYNKSVVKSVVQLESFLKQFNYKYIRPNDLSVYYNVKNIQSPIVWRELSNNPELSKLEQVHDDYKSLSDFYYFKACYKGKIVFIKYGGAGETCKNEYERSKQVYNINQNNFVESIAIKESSSRDYVIFEWIDGIPVEDYMENATEDKKSNIKEQMIEIYDTLQKAGIMHRDIRPGNLLMVDGKLKLIDFQYAIDINKPKELDCVKDNLNIPIHLGNCNFRYKPYAWRDSSSIIKCMKYLQIDTSDVILSEDRIFYMSFYNYYKYHIRKWLSKIKRSVMMHWLKFRLGK